MEQMQVVCPANAAAGSTINVVTPGGQVTCTVPAGVQPGMAFFIQVPAAAPPPVQAVMPAAPAPAPQVLQQPVIQQQPIVQQQVLQRVAAPTGLDGFIAANTLFAPEQQGIAAATASDLVKGWIPYTESVVRDGFFYIIASNDLFGIVFKHPNHPLSRLAMLCLELLQNMYIFCKSSAASLCVFVRSLKSCCCAQTWCCTTWSSRWAAGTARWAWTR